MSSEEKTKTYRIRLVKGFNHQLGHQRAGFRLFPGPDPIEVELTKDQLNLIKADPSIEIVKGKAIESAKSGNDEDPKTDTPPVTQPQGRGRNYEGNEAKIKALQAEAKDLDIGVTITGDDTVDIDNLTKAIESAKSGN